MNGSKESNGSGGVVGFLCLGSLSLSASSLFSMSFVSSSSWMASDRENGLMGSNRVMRSGSLASLPSGGAFGMDIAEKVRSSQGVLDCLLIGGPKMQGWENTMFCFLSTNSFWWAAAAGFQAGVLVLHFTNGANLCDDPIVDGGSLELSLEGQEVFAYKPRKGW